MKCPKCGSHHGCGSIERGFEHCWRCGITRDGYVIVRAPKDHPRPTHTNIEPPWIFEHILVAEKKIGRYLTENESVHHLDRIRDNNNPNNLEVVTEDDHSYYHKHIKKKSDY